MHYAVVVACDCLQDLFLPCKVGLGLFLVCFCLCGCAAQLSLEIENGFGVDSANLEEV